MEFRTKQLSIEGPLAGVRILTQNGNGPCPILALANVLLLRKDISFTSDSVSFDKLVEILGDFLLRRGESASASSTPDALMQAIELIPTLLSGLDVSLTFDHCFGFDASPSLGLFAAFGVALCHGWVSKGGDGVTGLSSYNQAMDAVIVPFACVYYSVWFPNELVFEMVDGEVAEMELAELETCETRPLPTQEPQPTPNVEELVPEPHAAIDDRDKGGEEEGGSITIPPSAAPVSDAPPSSTANAQAETVCGSSDLRWTHLAASLNVSLADRKSPRTIAVLEAAKAYAVEHDLKDGCEEGTVGEFFVPVHLVDELTTQVREAIQKIDSPISDPEHLDHVMESVSAIRFEEGRVASGTEEGLVASSSEEEEEKEEKETARKEPAAPEPNVDNEVLHASRDTESSIALSEPGAQPAIRETLPPFSLDSKRDSLLARINLGLISRNYISATSTQLTPFGLAQLTSCLPAGSLSVLFRNNHFSTLFHHPELGLFTLVTDEGFLTKKCVWESLSLDGDSIFCDIEFGAYAATASDEALEVVDVDDVNLEEQEKLMREILEKEVEGERVSAPPGNTFDADLALAMSLQDEENQQDEQRFTQQEQVQQRRQQQPQRSDISGSNSPRHRGKQAPSKKKDNDECVIQ
ncbi:hypothetical protein HDU98_010097 [Podochytrium sp. JEL0797]|nr:hypothetical protein HDU98_010097 [Podochytrium sp. JEL0797]